MEKSAKKVLLGLSGGVDSSTSAILLKNKGYDVTGYYFDIIGDKRDLEEVNRVAKELDIPLIYEDVSKEFNEIVIENFVSEYINGRTPNPCIICNPNVKFKNLLKKADELGFDYIATGHYAKIKKIDGIYYIEKAENKEKDQTYMLYRLNQDVLKRLIFPLGEFSSKDEIRELAKENLLENAEKKDSQEICFTEDYKEFIKSRGHKMKKGNFVNLEGKILGKHEGIINYTIGQRKGLGIALGKPSFVVDIDAEKNEIKIGDNEDLFSNIITSKDNFFTNKGLLLKSDDIKAKIRYSHHESEVSVKLENQSLIATFKDNQRAITKGQSIVFYKDDLVLGGGIID